MFASLMLFASCARDYEDDIMAAQEDMDALVQADQDLRAYLTQSIADARTRLNQMLDSEDATLQGEITAKVSELKGSIASRMQALEDLMGQKFGENEQRAQQKLDALNTLLNGSGGLKERLQSKLNQTRQAVLDAQTEHNAQLASSLQTYYGKLQSLQTTLANLSQTVNGLKTELDQLSNLNKQAKLTELEAKISALEQFDLDAELENLGASLRLFTEEKYAEMTTEDLDKLNAFYTDLVKYSSNVLTQYSDFEDDLDNYLQTYNSLQSDLDAAISEIEGLDTSFGLLDDVLDEEQTIDAIEDKITEIEGLESQVLQTIGELEACTDACDHVLADVTDLSDETNFEEYVNTCIMWNDAIQQREDDIAAWIDDLKERFPWWEW